MVDMTWLHEMVRETVRDALFSSLRPEEDLATSATNNEESSNGDTQTLAHSD